jgi:hypothetical protein
MACLSFVVLHCLRIFTMGEVKIVAIKYARVKYFIRPCTFVTERELMALSGLTAEEYLAKYSAKRKVLREGEWRYMFSFKHWNYTLRKNVATKLYTKRRRMRSL